MHIYKCENGAEVPSVTTILQVLGSQSIIKWANYLGFKHLDYETELQQAATNGTTVHSCIQSIVDTTVERPTFANPFDRDYYEKIMERFRVWISKFSYSTHFTEKTFASSTLGYGGTIDWYAELASMNMLLDFKTSKKVQLKHLLQLGGYTPLLEENGYPVDAAGIIIINSKECCMYPVNKQTLIGLSEDFRKIKEVYDIQSRGLPKKDENLLKTILGGKPNEN